MKDKTGFPSSLTIDTNVRDSPATTHEDSDDERELENTPLNKPLLDDQVERDLKNKIKEIEKNNLNYFSLKNLKENINKDIKEDISLIIKLDKEVNNHKKIIEQNEHEISVIESVIEKKKPKGFFGFIYQYIGRLFYGETEYDRVVKNSNIKRNFLSDFLQKTEIDQKNIKNELKALREERISQNVALEKVQKEIEELAIPGEKLNKESLLKLNGDLAKYAIIKREFIDRCSVSKSLGILVDREAKSVAAVKNQLRLFLETPTEDTLFALKKTMKMNLDYVNDLQLTTLLDDVRKSYPDVPSSEPIKHEASAEQPKEEFIKIDTVEFTRAISEDIAADVEAINTLNYSKKALERDLEQHNKHSLNITSTIETNKAALKESIVFLNFANQELAREEQEIKPDLDRVDNLKRVIVETKKIIELISNTLPASIIESVKQDTQAGRPLQLNFGPDQERILAILAPSATQDNPVPSHLNEETYNMFMSKLKDPETKQIVNAQVLEVTSIKKQIDRNFTRLPGFLEQAIREPLKAMEHRDRVIRAMYDLEDVFIDDQKSIDQLNQAMDRFMAVVDDPKARADEREQASLSFKDSIQSLDMNDDQIPAMKTALNAIDQMFTLSATVLQENIVWIDSDRAKSINPQDGVNKQAQITEIDHKILKLEAFNKLREERRANLDARDIQVTQTKEIQALIDTCSQPSMFNDEVRKALKNVLSNPTVKNLSELEGKMEADLSFLRNETLLNVMDGATKFYPAIGTALVAMKEKQAESPSIMGRVMKAFVSSVREGATESPTEKKSNSPTRNWFGS